MKLSEKLKDAAEVRDLVGRRASAARMVSAIAASGELRLIADFERTTVDDPALMTDIAEALQRRVDRIEIELMTRGLELDLSPDEASDLVHGSEPDGGDNDENGDESEDGDE
jgi:hypothetical protein